MFVDASAMVSILASEADAATLARLRERGLDVVIV